ncbi:MAG: ABC transporter ATP-binding protein [Bifidobacteriaceae bacterium]|jgi:putative ABC transport system ATP-binding protein|nr:ABC transporter ATP-binding protein [Bifidobacteriaceae bacterium]
MTDTVIAGSGLEYAYGRRKALCGVDIALRQGEVVAVMGPSGAGKSTLLHVLAGILRPDAGEVRWAGQRLDNLPDRQRSERRLRQIGLVLQFGDLIPELTLRDNIELPLLAAGGGAKGARARAEELMERLSIAGQADKRVTEVSGGQAQRAAVARALVHRPQLILADEPTGALDTKGGEQVLDALIGAAREQSAAVLIVTHELAVAARAERDLILRDGRIVADSRLPASPAPQPAAGTMPRPR